MRISMFKQCVSFDDVLLLPKISDISSRSEISLSSSLSKLNFNLPIISSPMDTVTEYNMAVKMGQVGGLGIVHRYNTIDDQSRIVSEINKSGICNIAAAIGVSDDYLERSVELVKAGANILCIDVAHGHHALTRHALSVLRNTLGWNIHIMAGNVATKEGFEDLASWGASSVRVGIGGGSICSTRVQTGHGMPTLQSIIECSEASDVLNIPIIADGGIKTSGDIVKALAAGANFVMLGSLLSGTLESPGEKIFKDGNTYKEYRGMASMRAQMKWRGRVSSREGVSAMIPYKGNVENVIKDLEAGIRSGLSYSGSRTINQLQIKSEFVRQTGAGIIESNTHVLSKGTALK